MTRRFLLAFFYPQKFLDPAVEFTELANTFIADWNVLISGHIKGKWDLALAEKVEKDFAGLVASPVWISRRKAK